MKKDYKKQRTVSAKMVVDGVLYGCYEGTHTEVEVKGSVEEELEVCIIPTVIYYEGKSYTVTRIGEAAFANAIYLEKVVLPDTITSIGNRAFEGCIS